MWRKFYLFNKLSNRFKGTKYMALWPDTSLKEEILRDHEYRVHREETAQVVARLEKKYQDRGLKFTVPFGGAVPVQAFGVLDDLYFYFRFRHDCGQLRLGPYDQKLEDQLWAAGERDRLARIAKHGPSDFGDRPKERVVEPGEDFYPTKIAKFGYVGDFFGEPYAGFLSPTEAEDLFVQLVDALRDIPEDEQIDRFTLAFIDDTREQLYAQIEQKETNDNAS